LEHWYVSALNLVESISQSDLPIAGEVRSAFARQFRGLWSQPLLRDELDRICRLLAWNGFWREGWIAVRSTLKYDYKNVRNNARTKLIALEETLRPRGLLQDVRGIVLGGSSYGIDLDDFDYDDDDGAAGALERIDRISASLGKAAALDSEVMKALLPDLTAGQGRLWSFGRGLALGTDNPHEMWNGLVAQFADTLPARRNTQVLRGYLGGLMRRDSALANELLDDAVANDALAPWFPELQTGVTIAERGAKRLLQSLTSGKAPPGRFQVLAWGKSADPISGPDLKALLLALASKDSGWDVAIEILYMRLFSDRQDRKTFDPALIEAGRELLKSFRFEHNPNGDHRFESLIEACLTGPGGAESVGTLCRRFKEAVANRETYTFENEHLLQGSFKAQPFAALDEFFGGDQPNRKRGLSDHRRGIASSSESFGFRASC
jgi:hypothetical protein